MKSNRIYIYLFIMMFLVSVGLAITVVDLSAQNKEDQETLCQLNEKINQLQVRMAEHLPETNKTSAQLALLRFKANVFQSKYPNHSEVAEIVFRKCAHYGFNPYLIMAIIQVESNFNTRAISKHGAYGLMQVNYEVWKDELKVDFTRIFEREYNIDLGLRILKHYYDKASGDMFMALFRYNNGLKNNNTQFNGKIASTCFSVPAIPETLNSSI